MQRALLLVLAAGVLVAGPSCSDESKDATTAVTAPPMPTTVAGYVPTGETVRSTLRILRDGEATVIPGFPITMNGCALGWRTVRWRSLGGPIEAGMAFFTDAPVVSRQDVEHLSRARAGLLQGGGCEQPAFFAKELVDVTVEFQLWEPSA